MTTTSLARTVQDSKAQRQERLKTRFRDRGGIFVPSEVNPLVDILLARGVNGESPVKKRTPRRSAKPRPSTATRAARTTKTPRNGSSKRAARKSAAVPSERDENHLPSVRKRRDKSKTPNLQEGKRINGVDSGTSAGPSRPRAAAQRRPFAVQLADAINSAMQTVPDSCLPSMKVQSVVPAKAPGTLPQSERALGKCKAKPAVLPPRYSVELDPFGGEPVCAVTTIKSPVVIALERQQREKQDGRRKFAAQESEQANGAKVKKTKPPLPHDLGGSDSDSDVPLAKKLAPAKSKRASASAGIRTRPSKREGGAPQPPKKRRSRSKVKALLGSADDPSNRATNFTETAKVQVLHEKKAPRKRKERVKASLDKDDNNNDDEQTLEQTHGPPKKKRRRADPTTASRGRKENKETSRSAREASVKKADKPLPSPVKQSARARHKPASKAKTKTVKPSSRAGVSAAAATRPRGLPLDVRRRIKVIAQNVPAKDDVDDPIDFLRC